MAYMGGKTRGKVLYECSDCGERHHVRTLELNRRNGDRCMGCGGRLIASSNNAIRKQAVATERWNAESPNCVQKRDNKGNLKE